MGYTKEQLMEMLNEVNEAIRNVLQIQEYSLGKGGMSIKKALLRDLMDREKWILEQLNKIEPLSTTNYVYFKN